MSVETLASGRVGNRDRSAESAVSVQGVNAGDSSDTFGSTGRGNAGGSRTGAADTYGSSGTGSSDAYGSSGRGTGSSDAYGSSGTGSSDTYGSSGTGRNESSNTYGSGRNTGSSGHGNDDGEKSTAGKLIDKAGQLFGGGSGSGSGDRSQPSGRDNY
ncbi:MAG: hypothetical protein M1826_003239 [Phylliscum demangeonii]|nr:MAG: hypothetical protein M1826_003239 [Phylliscum demangeonii]